MILLQIFGESKGSPGKTAEEKMEQLTAGQRLDLKLLLWGKYEKARGGSEHQP